MKRFLAFLICFFVFLGGLSSIVRAEPVSEPVPARNYKWVEPGVIVSADTFRCDPSCNNKIEQLCDDNENTYQRFIVNQRVYLYFEWGGTIWSNCTIQDVDASVLREHPNWTLDRKTTEWPRGSSGGNCPQQPQQDSDWPVSQWKYLNVNEYLHVSSGIVYYNYTSQSVNTNSISITKNTIINTINRSVWIWVTTSGAKLYTSEPSYGYEKITLSPPTNTNPQEEEGWLYSYIPPHGFSTGWIWVYLNNNWVDFKQSCLNGLVVENNSDQQIRIRYQKADPADPRDRRLVTIYGSGNSLESIKSVYANTINVPISHLSVRKVIINSPN